jgi:hypothetical protein
LDWDTYLPAITTVAAATAVTTAAASATTAMAATTTTAATASAAVPATTTPAPATATAATLCLWTRFIHNEVSPAEILAIQGVDGAVCVFVIGNFDEREAARLSRETVTN